MADLLPRLHAENTLRNRIASLCGFCFHVHGDGLPIQTPSSISLLFVGRFASIGRAFVSNARTGHVSGASSVCEKSRRRVDTRCNGTCLDHHEQLYVVEAENQSQNSFHTPGDHKHNLELRYERF